MPKILSRVTKKLTLTLVANSFDPFKENMSDSLVKIRYLETLIDAYPREVEVFSDLVKPADFSTNSEGQHRRLVMIAMILIVLVLACFTLWLVRVFILRLRK